MELFKLIKNYFSNNEKGKETAPLEDDFILTDEISNAIEIIESKDFKILFITGKAGTGKSTFLKYLKNSTLRSSAVFLAPTGVAAVNIGGQTLHSFFKLPPRFIDEEDIEKSKRPGIYQKIEYIIIDECSMLKADTFDAINRSLQLNRNNSRPFGGVKIILFGDLYQLPPVMDRETDSVYKKKNYKTPYFFSSYIFKLLHEEIESVELTKVFRQNDDNYINILDDIRSYNLTNDLMSILDQKIISNGDNLPDNMTILTTTNKLAKKYNDENLKKLKHPAIKYKADIEGAFNEKDFPTDEELELKKNAKIIFIKNDPQKRWINGTIGTVWEVHHDHIVAQVKNSEYEVYPEKWEKIQYQIIDNKLSHVVVGTYRQLPVRLGWAITIHKSQGLTLDNILVDSTSKAFAPGQIYVALSRCRSFNNLFLEGAITPSDIIINDDVNRFISYMKRKKLFLAN